MDFWKLAICEPISFEEWNTEVWKAFYILNCHIFDRHSIVLLLQWFIESKYKNMFSTGQCLTLICYWIFEAWHGFFGGDYYIIHRLPLKYLLSFVAKYTMWSDRNTEIKPASKKDLFYFHVVCNHRGKGIRYSYWLEFLNFNSFYCISKTE